jgi:Holliday junction resolvasome RuvABC endonuclease subunit
MAKIYIAIDPGISKTGLAAIDEQDRVLHTELILVSPTLKQKKILKLEKRWQLVNYKLTQIKNRLESTITDIIKKCGTKNEIIVAVEAFGYYAPKQNARKMVNYIYETIAGITMTKCVLLNMNLVWQEIPAGQIKRTITLFANGTPEVKVSKEEIQDGIKKLYKTGVVEAELQKYAKNYREHVGDALALCQTIKRADEYHNYMKLSPKKRKEWYANYAKI